MLIYIVWLHKVIYAHFYCKATHRKVPLFAVHVFLSPSSLTAQSLIVDIANLHVKVYYFIVLLMPFIVLWNLACYI